MSTTISRLYNFVTDKGNSVKITASRVDGELDQDIVALNRKVLCSGSAPSSPIAGQTWVDTTNKFLKLYRNNEWVIMGPVHVAATAGVMATPQEGDLWYDTTANALKAYNGSTWDTMGVTFTPTAANALAGSVIQVVNTQTGAMATGTTAIPDDDTIPQITEGDQYMTRAITPNNASNLLKISIVANIGVSTGMSVSFALFQDAIAGALAAVRHYITGTDSFGCISFIHYMTAGTTSSTTFRLRVGGTTGTLTFNGTAGARKLGGVLASSITIEEIKA